MSLIFENYFDEELKLYNVKLFICRVMYKICTKFKYTLLIKQF